MINRRIKYRHIECFTAIERLGSLKAASETLCLSQPALSKTLRDIEEILGTRLMERDRGGIQLTPEGEVFSEYASLSLLALRRGVDGVAALRSGSRQQLRIGTLPSVAARLLPIAIREFGKLSPATQLIVRDGAHGTLTQQLRNGDLDVVIGRMGPADAMQGLGFMPLYTESVVCVVRPGHPLAQRSGLDAAELMNWPVIYPPEGSAIRPQLDQWRLAQGLGGFANRIESVSGAFGRNHTGTTDAVWFISEGVVAQDLAEERLRALPLDLSLTAGPVGLMTRPDSPETGPGRLFARSALQAAKTMGIS